MAPHIASLGTAFGARFDLISYRLEGDRLVSNVRYSSSLAQARPSADGDWHGARLACCSLKTAWDGAGYVCQ